MGGPNPWLGPDNLSAPDIGTHRVPGVHSTSAPANSPTRPPPNTLDQLNRLVQMAMALDPNNGGPEPGKPGWADHIADMARFYKVPYEEMEGMMMKKHADMNAQRYSDTLALTDGIRGIQEPATQQVINTIYKSGKPQVGPTKPGIAEGAASVVTPPPRYPDGTGTPIPGGGYYKAPPPGGGY